MLNPTFRFLYLQDRKNQPVACIAMCYNKTKSDVKVGVSTTHPIDRRTYKKEVARALAVGRAVLEPITVMIVPSSDLTTHDILYDVVSHLYNKKLVPTRVKNSIKAWMSKSNAIQAKEDAQLRVSMETPSAPPSSKELLVNGGMAPLTSTSSHLFGSTNHVETVKPHPFATLEEAVSVHSSFSLETPEPGLKALGYFP